MRLCWGLQHWRSEFNYRSDGILTCFSILILWTLCGKPMRERQKALFCSFMVFSGVWIVNGWGVVGKGRKSYLGAAEIASFSSRNFSRSNKHDTFSHVVTTGYFYVLFLWNIAVSDFCLLEIYKNLGFLLLLSLLQSTATQITISINIFMFFQILYSLKSVLFLLKYTLKWICQYSADSMQ